MLPQLANTNCIIVHHLTDAVFKETQDKTSIATSCVAQTPCRRKTAHTKAKGSFYNPRDCITGLSASLAAKRVSWTLDITYWYFYDFLWI